jgi:hypothetical protein
VKTIIWALAGLVFGVICVLVTACGGGEERGAYEGCGYGRDYDYWRENCVK